MMECPKCGAKLEKTAKFCNFCGAFLGNTEAIEIDHSDAIHDEKDEPSMPTNPLKTDRKKERKENDIGLLVGTIIICIGLVKVMTAGTSISDTTFGGDFYTYAYHGIVEISQILASIEQTLGWVIVAIGAAIDVISMGR